MLPQAARILIVDDEPAIADTLLYVLRTEGHQVEHVSLGAEALARHAMAPFDLWLLDVGLPDATGFEVLKRLRSGERAAAIPVLFLTARSGEIDRILGLELGADDYVVKPFSPREVAARVRAVLRRSRPETAVVPCIWQRQPEALRILYHGHLLDLTRYEYRLLDLLIGAPGRILTREIIMERVWGDAPETSDRTIDAHIKTLRAKLRAICADEDPIQTHRGVGYGIKP